MRARDRYCRSAVERFGVNQRVNLWNGCERSSGGGSTFAASIYRVSRKLAVREEGISCSETPPGFHASLDRAKPRTSMNGLQRLRADTWLAAHAEAAAGQAGAGVFVDYQRAHFAARFVVDKNNRRTIFAPQPIAAPSPHRGEHVPKCAPLVSQTVFVTRWMIFIGHFFQQAFLDQPIEPPREHRARDFQCALEILEAAPS